MNTKDLDIVYCVKESPDNPELKYSLRSLKNMPHRKVWIYGGCPDWVDTEKVNWVKMQQGLGSKWANASSLLRAICGNAEITDDFIWFNDDFFVLQHMENLPYYFDRTLISRVMDFSKISWNAMNNGYCSRLKRAMRALRWNDKDILNYELHIPMVFNRNQFKTLFTQYPGIGAKRSLYGNTFGVGGVQRRDVKIYDMESKPTVNWDFVSTSDGSFKEGAVGKYIRNKFRGKGEYERK